MLDIPSQSIVLGITGGIACGKSETGRILEKLGFAVCDADRVAHNLMKKGAEAYRQVAEYFGSGILQENGEISRPILGRIVFDDPEKRKALNNMVHPVVRNELEQWIRGKKQAGKNGAVLIPLLFEAGMQDLGFDAVLCVTSAEQNVLRRMKQRGLSIEEINKRISSQLPLAEKEKRADIVIPNNGSLDALAEAITKAVGKLTAER